MELIATLRRLMLVVLIVGMSGTLVELLLLAHYDGRAQLIPLALLVLAILTVIWHVARPCGGSIRILRAMMVAFIVAGVAGVGLHLNGAAEFQREIDPALHGWSLFRKIARVHAPPMLAPGVLLQLGLIGLIYAYRFPITGAAGAHHKDTTL